MSGPNFQGFVVPVNPDPPVVRQSGTFQPDGGAESILSFMDIHMLYPKKINIYIYKTNILESPHFV